MMDTFNGALTLNQTLLRNMRDSPQVVQRGLLVVLLVGMLVGGVNGIRTLMNGLNPEQQLDQTREQIRDQLELQALNSNQQQREVIGLFLENLDSGFEIAQAVTTLPTTLPQSVGALAQGLGVFVSRPLGYLGSLLLWVIFTHIAARWLGGQGSIQQMLGLGALSVAPHALDALAFIPVLGQLASIGATVWGLVILIVGTSVAHRLEIGRATLAVLLFPGIGLLVALLGCCIFFAVVLFGAGAA